MGKLKSFRTFGEEKINGIVITIDNFQPPSLAHEKLLETVSTIAVSNKYAIYSGTDQGPLSYDAKIKYLRKIFPRYGRNIIESHSYDSMSDIFISLKEHGYDKITLVYANPALYAKFLKESHNHYFKNGISFVRVEDTTDNLIEAARQNSLETFSKGLPRSFGEVLEMFNTIRTSIGLKETSLFRKHIQIEKVSEAREAYIQGQLFSVADRVNIIGSDLSGIVSKCGPNYIIVEASDGKSYRKWLDAVEKI